MTVRGTVLDESRMKNSKGRVISSGIWSVQHSPENGEIDNRHESEVDIGPANCRSDADPWD